MDLRAVPFQRSGLDRVSGLGFRVQGLGSFCQSGRLS